MGTGQATGPGGSSGGSATPDQLTPPVGPSAPANFHITPSIEMPLPALLPIESDFINALATTTFAQGRATNAEAFIAQLGALAAALVPPTVNPTFPTNTNPPAISVPVAPGVAPSIYTPPPLPAPFNGSLDLAESFPTNDAVPPSLAFPAAPLPPNITLPPQPGIDTNFVYPTVNVDLPIPPPLLSVSVAPFSGVSFPTLSATEPTFTLAQPSLVQYIPDAPYTDALLSELTMSLQARLDIGNTGTNTGLPPAVEENIWNRGREREYRTQADSLAALDRMEAMGYAFPPGVFIDAGIKIRQESDYLFMGQSRDIATAQAKLEQDNIAKAIDAATQIEGKLIDYANQTEQRRFEACKYATQAGVDIYNAAVNAFGARVNAYKAAIDYFSAQLEQAKTVVAVYQAEIDAEKLKVDANNALIQQYDIMVKAALASIDVFKGEIDIIRTEAEVEQLKVQIYGEEVRAYAAEANVYTAQVEGYKATVEAEQTKEQVYATQVQAYGTLVDAVTKQINAQVEVFKAQLAEKSEELDAYRAAVAGQTAQVQAIASQNDSVAKIYTAEVSGVSSYNEALVKEYEAQNTLATSIAQIGVAAAQANGNLYLTTKSIATDAAKVGAQVEAQIAASALGAVTWATHRARQDAVSMSQSVSFGNNLNESQQLGYSFGSNNNTSTQVSSSTQFSSSVAASTSEVHQIQSVE